MKKAIIYARFSPRKNAELCESIETQTEACKDWCQKNGYEVMGLFDDQALSGAEEDRPGLWAAVDALHNGWTLVVYKLDRLARDLYLSWLIEKAAERAGAAIISLAGEGTQDNSPENELVRRILQAVSVWERKVIAARTSAAMLRHQRAGRRMSDRCPYGWMKNPDDPAFLVEDPGEQAVIKRMMFLYEVQGLSPRAIQTRLLAEKVWPRKGKGKKFGHHVIESCLKRAGATKG